MLFGSSDPAARQSAHSGTGLDRRIAQPRPSSSRVSPTDAAAGTLSMQRRTNERDEDHIESILDTHVWIIILYVDKFAINVDVHVKEYYPGTSDDL